MNQQQSLEPLINLSDSNIQRWNIIANLRDILNTLEHDDYKPYIDRLERWKNDYLGHLNVLMESLKTFDNHVLLIINQSELKYDFTDKEKTFLSTVLSLKG